MGAVIGDLDTLALAVETFELGALTGRDAGFRDALILVALFGLKHFVCDFMLQSGWQAANKGAYGHPAGLVHVGIHALGTAPILLGLAALPFAAFLIAEAAVHYHIDWAKMRIGALAGWTPAQGAFWVAIGFDQALHLATYLAMVAVLAFA